MREIAIVRKIDTKSRETNQRKAHGERDPNKKKNIETEIEREKTIQHK